MSNGDLTPVGPSGPAWDMHMMIAALRADRSEFVKAQDELRKREIEFQFEDQGKNPTMRISEDGTVVQTLKK